MNTNSMRFGRLSAVVLALSVLAGAASATTAQARSVPADGSFAPHAQAAQERDVPLTAERFQDAGLYDCSGTDLHTHLQRQACR